MKLLDSEITLHLKTRNCLPVQQFALQKYLKVSVTVLERPKNAL
jgi:hypothetical protein